MCITAFWVQPNDAYQLILVSNRDEFYSRLSMPAHWWSDGILAGKDLEAGGTWLGVSNSRFATITNYRDMAHHKEKQLSRGKLVYDFLVGSDSLATFKQSLKATKSDYNPYNLLFYDHMSKGMYYYSNVTGGLKQLERGFYVLSNHLLNTPWPKTERLTTLLKDTNLRRPSVNTLFEILCDSEIPEDTLLPKTGLALDIERLLSSIFIKGETYGTRFQSVFLLEESGVFTLHERALNHSDGIWEYQSFQSDFNDLMIT